MALERRKNTNDPWLTLDVDAAGVADGSINTPKLADGAVTEIKMGFDVATQAELNTAQTNLAATNLAGNAAVGATSITVAGINAVPLAIGNFILIDAYTSQAELRKVTAVAGATVTFASALEYAHSASDQVLVLANQGVLTTPMWGLKGDNSTDEHTGLQEAVIQCAIHGSGIWLDGQNRAFHMVGQPLLVNTSTKLRQVNVKAKTGVYAPVDSTNAMVMAWNGNLKAFTADPSTDEITATAHGIPADNIGVVFQAATMPGGLTAGKFYYARDRTANTFKVSETSGGAAVNITSAGSGGRAFCEVYSTNCKTIFEDCLFDGALISNLNGLLLSLQQPGYADKLRVDDFDGYGVKMKGQQYVLYNFMSDQCRQALVLDDMSFLYSFSFNAEKCDKGIYVATGGAHSCTFYSLHFEMLNTVGYSTTTSIAIHFVGSTSNMVFEGANVSMQASGQTFFQTDVAAASQAGYALRNVRWSSALGSAGQTMVNDVARGIVLDQQTDCRSFLHSLDAPLMPSSQSLDDLAPCVWVGPGGRRVTLGAQNNDQPQVHVLPGTSQTGDTVRADDTSGNRVSGFNKAGVFFTERNTVPADGDLVAGELTLWFDDTNGAAKLMIKAKEAGGTVRTGSVNLA